MRIEKTNICKHCGGKCCKRSGCDYFVSDFEAITEEILISKLNEGETSIVSVIQPYLDNTGNLTIKPYLYLRARNLGRDIIDIFSFKHECMLLTETGCPYPIEKRPGGGAALIPMRVGRCYRNEDPIIEALKWEPYQELLARLVREYSGMSVEEVFKRDIEQVLYEVLMEDFAGVDKEELKDMLDSVPLIVYCFPDLYVSARNRAMTALNKNTSQTPKTLNYKKDK